jgi:hypothetical protein
VANGALSVCIDDIVCATGFKCSSTRKLCYLDDACTMDDDDGLFDKIYSIFSMNHEQKLIVANIIKGFQGQITVGGVSMAAFDLSGQTDFGSKLCWSPNPLSGLYYCINPTTCPGQDPDLGKRILIPG